MWAIDPWFAVGLAIAAFVGPISGFYLGYRVGRKDYSRPPRRAKE